MFTDMADVSAIGLINKDSFVLAAAGYLCVNFEIRGAGSELSKHWRHRDECLFIRHRYYCMCILLKLTWDSALNVGCPPAILEAYCRRAEPQVRFKKMAEVSHSLSLYI